MSADWLSAYSQVWCVDFEFHAPPGERPLPICMVGREIHSGRLLRLWSDQLADMVEPPFSTGPDVMFVAYLASAELGCYLALGWPMPTRILDLFVEFRCTTNGLKLRCGNGLLGALAHYGLPAIDGAEKKEFRDLAIRGGPFTDEERVALLNYCESDVNALANLLPRMAPAIDLPRALIRGRYMSAVARMEWNGTSIDTDTLDSLRANWGDIKGSLIAAVDRDFGVYDNLAFKRDRFAGWLIQHDIPWPRLPSGQLALDDDTFKEMSRMYPVVGPLRELRHTVGQMRLESLTVGRDNRNRCMLSPFRAKTGRNQPSTSKFIFGPSTWLRSLIKPEPGRAIVYIDWVQQEFAISAVLSGDPNMIAAYRSGDVYLTFAKQAGAVPTDATKESHPRQRELFKICSLATLYGQGPDSLAHRLGQPVALARELLSLHRSTYPKFWEWNQGAINHAMLRGWLQTTFGWRIHTGPGANVRSLGNFPSQANGAEMLRLACCLATERGIQVCAPVHDALLVEGPNDDIEQVVAETQRAMREASRIVLDGFELETDATVFSWPARYIDPRGEKLWSRVLDILEDKTPENKVGHREHPTCFTVNNQPASP